MKSMKRGDEREKEREKCTPSTCMHRRKATWGLKKVAVDKPESSAGRQPQQKLGPRASQVQNYEQCTSVVWRTWCMVFVIATELKHPFPSENTSLTWRLLWSELVLPSHFKIITSIGTMSENIAWSSPFYHIHFDRQINKGKKNIVWYFSPNSSFVD